MSERDDTKPPEDGAAPPPEAAGKPEGEARSPAEAGAAKGPEAATPEAAAPEAAAPEVGGAEEKAASTDEPTSETAEPAAKPGKPSATRAAKRDEEPDEPAAEAEDEAAKKAAAAAAAQAKREAAARAKAEAEAAKPPWERAPVPPEWQEAAEDPLAAALADAHGDAVVSARTFAGDLVLELVPDGLVAVAADLSERGYKLLVDVCGAHYPKREEGQFEVVYLLYSLDENRRVRLKVRTDEATPVPSVTGIWKGADWPEREVWDMFGVQFSDHPDMTRILMWEGFNGHPLRKDFPVEGIDTGSAIYPEYYDDEAGPVAGTGTGWRPPEPPADEAEETEEESAE